MTPCIANGVLFAAGWDWLEALLPFLFVAFWILSQVFAMFRKLPGAGPKPPALRPEMVPQRAPDPFLEKPALDPRVDLQRQIEEFLLNRGDDRLAKPSGQALQPTRAPSNQPVKQPTRATVKRLPEKVGRPITRQPQLGVQPVESFPLSATGEDRRLGSFQTGATDVARHVSEAFAHDLSHQAFGLAQQTSAAAKVGSQQPSVSPAVHLANLLRSPTAIRQIILLQEVLQRPLNRW